MGDDGQERTEQATIRHRLEARRKGTVAKSVDLTNAVVIVALMLVLPFGITTMGQGLVQAMRFGTSYLPSDLSTGRMAAYFQGSFRPVLPGLAAIVCTAMAVGLTANFAQVGFVLSGQALTPNFQKLNPLTGMRRFVSRISAFEAAKAIGKTILFGSMAYLTIRGSWGDLTHLSVLPPREGVAVAAGIARTMAIRIAMVWMALAGIDYFFQRQQVERQLRMTKEEVKREMRELETSPEVKAVRNMRRRRLMRRLREAVRTADVVITNPTHYAVALKYEPGRHHAPMVVAKGADYVAARIREEAVDANVPLVPNPPLARALYRQCEVGDFVPRELFQAVAEVLAYVYRTLKKVPRAGGTGKN
jgi:flagellar biosynthetic protein FlhB